MFLKSKKILSVMVAMAIMAGIMPFSPFRGDNTPLASFLQFTRQIAQANDVVTINVGTVDSSGTGYTYSSTKITLTGGYDYVLTGSMANKQILIETTDAVNVTLDNVTINASMSLTCAFGSTDGATINLTLIGENTLKGGDDKPGLEVLGDTTLTIGGTGSLEAIGGDSGAGIGGGDSGDVGDITINSGTVTANGGNYGAGIGGGDSSDSGKITINSGTVTANGGDYAAGIGGGYGGSGSETTINGGSVTANGGDYGAGIGGGNGSSGGEITIKGGSVTATGGDGSAGIGGGEDGTGGVITITGGTINATGKDGGAAIGGGDGYSPDGTVTIYGGSVWMSNFDGPQPEDSLETSVYLNTITLGSPAFVNRRVGDGGFDDGAGYDFIDFVDKSYDSLITTSEYSINDVVTDGEGKLYFWLPASIGAEPAGLGVFGNRYTATYTREANNNNAVTLTGENAPAIEITGENADNTDYVTWDRNNLKILQDGEYTLSLRDDLAETTRARVKVEAGVTADITLDSLKIDVSLRDWIDFACAFDMTGATVDLTLVGENVLISDSYHAGLQISADSTLTIDGDGSLNAVGGLHGAGIGGGYQSDNGKITINNGKIKATGTISSEVGSGIGGGAGGQGGEININGGTITTTRIGGGSSKLATGTVTIDGGSVKLNNFGGPQPKNSSLENVYLNTLTLDDPSAANALVTSLTTAAVAGPASAIMAGTYGTNGVFTDASGIIYAWLPESAAADEEVTVKAGGKTYTSSYVRAADNNNTSTLTKIAGAGDVKALLTPDSLSKNAGAEGVISVSFDNATSYDAYALAIPMLFDRDTIEITNLETVDFTAKGLTGLLVNGTFLSGARDYDASSEVLSVINNSGKFLLSWTVEEDTPLVPHTLTEDVYFKIHYRVKENVPTSASFAIGEYNDTNGITSDPIFGIDGRGIVSSNQDDFGAYLLVDGEDSILTQEYVSITVEDMPPVEISGDVNSISLQGRAMLTGKQRTAISAIGYTPSLNKIDAGIRVEMYEVDGVGGIVKQVGSVAYTQEMNMTAAISDPSSTLYNYTLNIPRTVANDLVNSDPDQSSPKYMLRFSRFGDNGGSVVGIVREESYLWADIYLDGTAVNTTIIDEATPLTVGDTAYLYAGAFYLADSDKTALSTADLNTIKGQVGNADMAGVTTIFNINEYLGVDAADYTTVLRYVGQKKLQSLPLA
ncbi:MAG: carbohydrate-binding domain-containing protein, partial [Clostridiales bacterium]|nr:carbohydrate-binding domain-containing protein [Clostridiales bacterium]